MSKKLSEADIKNICNIYLTENVSMDDLAKLYNCSSSHISKTIHKSVVLRDN